MIRTEPYNLTQTVCIENDVCHKGFGTLVKDYENYSWSICLMICQIFPQTIWENKLYEMIVNGEET